MAGTRIGGWGRRLAGGVAVALLALVVANAVVSEWEPPPRTQVVRTLIPAQERWPDWDPAVPYWELAADRQNEACLRDRPDAPRVLFLGDSVFYGYALEAADVFTTRMQRDLDRLHGGAGPCVLNFAQPGFSGQQMLELARVLVPRLRPDLVVWEAWRTNEASYTRLGDAAYVLDRYRVDADGYPRLPGVPASWNAWLFRNVRLYEYATLALGQGAPVPPERGWLPRVSARLREVRDLARAHGARLLLVGVPALDRPFRDPSDLTRSMAGDLDRIAGGLGVDLRLLDRVLEDQDVEAVRLDPCCHFNAEGHRVLADRLAPEVEARLSPALSAAPSAPGR